MITCLNRALAALALGACLLAAGAAPVLASPVTVNLRIEGSSGTIFEGPLTTDAHPGLPGTDSSSHAAVSQPCNYKDNGTNGGFGPTLATPTGAVYDATQQLKLSFGATWYSGQKDFFVTQVGSDANQSSGSFASWGFAVNYTTSSVGGCQLGLAPGNDVLWAYDFFNKSHLLRLTGPASAELGQPVTVTVVDGQTGSPVAGATIASATTDQDGHAQVSFDHTGTQSLKADKADSVRSNRLDVCVHHGNDGTCGTSAPAPPSTPTTASPSSPAPPLAPATSGPAPAATPPLARLAAPRHRIRYSHGRGPRTLRGSVGGALAGVALIRLRLAAINGGRCRAFDGRLERLRPARCGVAHAPWFSVGGSLDFSYLLPFVLPAGHYVIDMEAFDRAGRRDVTLLPGRSRVIFDVA